MDRASPLTQKGESGRPNRLEPGGANFLARLAPDKNIVQLHTIYLVSVFPRRAPYRFYFEGPRTLLAGRSCLISWGSISK